MKNIEVVAAIFRKANTIFATEKGYGEFKGYWEFPGGKVEPGESLVIILGYFEPPVRVFGATVPEKGSHEFRCSRATFVPCL